MRAAVFSIHELSLVYGSRTTLARWNVVSHSSNGRVSPPSDVSSCPVPGCSPRLRR